MNNDLRAELIQRAIRAKETSYSPYSKFRVGAAVLTGDGEIFSGCNVENASYGLAICAERNAIFQMAFAGKRKIVAVAVTSDETTFITPCGACRQVISEFAGPGTEILLITKNKKIKSVKFGKIFPAPPSLEKLKK
ncbi:MAG: cytidine deaminase [Ignavibacteriales bacterium]|nr:cytidine deaminase [Ignavibacteriales bacterium]